nr:MAG TPA: hypothetical protein [Caudoviricetes sp.]
MNYTNEGLMLRQCLIWAPKILFWGVNASRHRKRTRLMQMPQLECLLLM